MIIIINNYLGTYYVRFSMSTPILKFLKLDKCLCLCTHMNENKLNKHIFPCGNAPVVGFLNNFLLSNTGLQKKEQFLKTRGIQW